MIYDVNFSDTDQNCGFQFQKAVNHFFHDLCLFIARRPFIFLFIPLIISSLMTIVLILRKDAFSTDNRINKEMNNLMNYLPESAESVKNFHSMNSKVNPLFNNLNEDKTSEMTRKVYDWSKQPYAYVILIDNGKNKNMLQENNLKIAQEIVGLVLKIQVLHNSKNFSWSDLCQKSSQESDQCLEHPFVTLLRQPSLPIVQLSLLMKYPEIRIQNLSIDTTILFGKVKQNGLTGLVESVAALRLPFLLRNEPKNQEFSNLVRKWQRKFVDLIPKLKHKTLAIDFSTSISLNDEIARNGKLLIDYLPAVFCALVVFSCFCCFHIDWVLSQPLLGFCGVLTAAQAVIVAFGVLVLAGFPFIQMVYIMPFFVLAVSADNAFLVLNAWRNTHPLADTKHRLAKAVGSTSISIMITALTDGFSFTVGTISQFPAVRIFCTYCALAILCSFLFQMTFFVACLVLCARRESSNRHCLCWWRVHPRVESTNKSIFYQTCCAGGYLSRREKIIPNKFHARWLSDFVTDTFANLLDSSLWRLIILSVYCIYLSMSIYGIYRMKIGLELRNLVPYDSYVVKDLKINDKYFSDYGTYATVIVNETLDLDDQITVNRLLDLYRFLSKTDYADQGEFWLQDFLVFNKSVPTVNSYSFLATLDDFLDNLTYSKYANDLKFSDHEGKLVISATKFYVRLRNVSSENRVTVAKSLKEKFSKFGFAGFIYDPTFLLIDQQDATVQSVLQDVLVTVAVMIVITLLFIPKFLCAFWIGLSIVSINVGVLGFLALWGVYLDIVSMLTSFMSVGLSVDYVAHVTYHYLAVKASSHEARLKRTMHHVAVPAIQSATSAILGVSILDLVESYIVRTFVKTVVLVVLLGLAHGLLFLPVSLSFFVPVDQYIDSFASNYGRVKEYLATSLNFAPYFYQSSQSDRPSNYSKTTTTPTDPASPCSAKIDDLSEKRLPKVPNFKRDIILAVDVEACKKEAPNQGSSGHLYDSPTESEYRSVELECPAAQNNEKDIDSQKQEIEGENCSLAAAVMAMDLSSRSAMKKCMALKEGTLFNLKKLKEDI